MIDEEEIKKICKDIEREEGVKIIFCVESGSRAWRMDSVNSDYDVRYVFVRPLKEYVQINKPGEVLARHYNKELERVGAEGCFIDVCGFDIFKYTKMLSASNPTTLEWLQSDIQYYGEKPQVFVDFALKQYKPISVYHHYKSMCRQNYLKYLQTNSDVTYKKYLYALRGLLNAKWIVLFKTLPPISFQEALREFRAEYFRLTDGERAAFKYPPIGVLDRAESIIKLKKKGKEKGIVERIPQIDEYVESCLKDDSEAPTKKTRGLYTPLNEELQRILGL